MKDNSFIDTNMFIYSHSDIDQKKQDVARFVILVHVNETSSNEPIYPELLYGAVMSWRGLP